MSIRRGGGAHRGLSSVASKKPREFKVEPETVGLCGARPGSHPDPGGETGPIGGESGPIGGETGPTD